MAALRSLDKRLWLVPLIAAAVAAATVIVGCRVTGEPWPRIAPAERSAFMSSLAGSAAGLLGVALAAVSVLIALPAATHQPVGKARQRIAVALLVQGGLLAVLLMVATYSILVPPTTWSLAVMSACVTGGIVGFLVIGAAFVLAIFESGLPQKP